MKRFSVVRSLIAATVAVALLAGVAENSRAADSASITIHVLQCDHVPTTDWFNECHDNNVTGSSVTVGGVTKSTDETGNAAFTGLAAGDYAVSAVVPGASTGFFYCSSPAGRAESAHVNGVFTVTGLAAGEAVICDSFGVVAPAVTPASATGTLTVHKRVCASGQPVNDIFTDCHDNLDGVSGVVQLTAGGVSQTVGDSGNVSWTLDDGTYDVAEDVSVAGAVSSRVFCSVDDGSAAEVSSSNGDFSVTIAGDSVICDSYTFLAAPAPSATAAPSTSTPAPTATATSSGNGATSLPSTGVAQGDGGNTGLLAAVLAALAIVVFAMGGVELARRRKS